MKHIDDFAISYPTAFFSAFDITGSFIISNTERPPSHIHSDMDRLINDLEVLDNDYHKAIEKIDEENR